MLSSPRSPSSTMRILSSAEKCRRVARRMVFSTCVAGSFTGPDFCLIFAPRKATMSQRSSLPHPAESISRVLTADTIKAGEEIAEAISPDQDRIVATYMQALADITGRTAELRIKARVAQE